MLIKSYNLGDDVFFFGPTITKLAIIVQKFPNNIAANLWLQLAQ